MKLISIETQIIKATIQVLLAEGYMLAVDDGGEIALQKTQDADAILAAMRTTDEDYLIVYRQGYGSRREGWVRFIYGNDDIEVLNDYTMNLHPVMGEIMDAIMKYEAN